MIKMNTTEGLNVTKRLQNELMQLMVRIINIYIKIHTT